jgi:hypothetical protein
VGHRHRHPDARPAVAAAVPPNPLRERIAVGYRLADARAQRDDLPWGRGDWAGTAIGDAARGLAEARGRRQQAERFARDPQMSWRMRRTWQRDARDWARAEADAQAVWDDIGAAPLAQLEDQVARLTQREEQLRDAGHRLDDWVEQHPEVPRRLRALDREIEQLAPSPTLEAVRSIDVPAIAAQRDAGIDLGL